MLLATGHWSAVLRILVEDRKRGIPDLQRYNVDGSNASEDETFSQFVGIFHSNQHSARPRMPQNL